MIPVDTRNILFICGGAFEGNRAEDSTQAQHHRGGIHASRSRDHYDKDDLLKYIAPRTCALTVSSLRSSAVCRC
jgi:ATP-dependent Clp protease ATP-binding subunit ClpX